MPHRQVEERRFSGGTSRSLVREDNKKVSTCCFTRDLDIFVLNYAPMRLISFIRFLKMETIDIIEFSQLRYGRWAQPVRGFTPKRWLLRTVIRSSAPGAHIRFLRDLLVALYHGKSPCRKPRVIFGIRLPSFVRIMINLRIPISTTSFSWKASGFFFVAYVGKIRLTSAALGSGNSPRAWERLGRSCKSFVIYQYVHIAHQSK